MARKGKDKLDWCIVRLGEDMNWWVEETSDPVNWDVVDGLSILDPRQIGHVVDLSDSLVDYGFQPTSIDKAFYKFHIEKDLGKGRIRLSRVPDSIFDDGVPLFALPDIMDEEKGPYADLLHSLTRTRVKMLNDVIELEEHLTIEDLEDEIREQQNEVYMDGKSVHLFTELVSILEYVPEGFELDEDDDEVPRGGSSELDEEFPDLDEDDEKIEEDETMKWGDEEEGEEEKEGFGLLEEDEEEEEEEPVKKTKTKAKKKVEKPAVAKKKSAVKAAPKKKAKK